LNPLVTIIVASFNKARFIEETIHSVIEQTYTNWELLIVDDASNDGTADIIKNHTDERIKAKLLLENKGANHCRNIGIKDSRGEYLVFLDADDVLRQDCLKVRVQSTVLCPDCDFLVFTMGVFKKAVGDTRGLWRPRSKAPLRDFLKHNLPWSILQPMWKRDFLLAINGFDESFQRLQDVEISTRALLVPNVRYKLIDGKPDCYYRIDELRLNFDVNVFLGRWIESTVKYFEKFEKILEPKIRRNIAGTIFQTYLQLIHYYKENYLTEEQFTLLENKLVDYSAIATFLDSKMFLFKIAKWYNFRLIRIPGINFLLKKAVVL